MQEVAHFFRPKPGVINTAFSFNENLILRSDQPLSADRSNCRFASRGLVLFSDSFVHVFCKIVIERAGIALHLASKCSCLSLKCNFMGSNQVSLLVFCLIVLKM
ncbi:uncharacterized protein LOC133717093 isoform X3 [Rosa rugosa]|uniref:uncharacterized protein LOC133717093 isoform X3 n=2 Tax=Rosa rugosa TaxID=74645 RepID=UPI002B4159D0|nr:uncharacterized protein LOC133717093 isoform X3 [Rosa rugosa]